MSLGEHLRTLRERDQMHRTQSAEKASVSTGHLRNIEEGISKPSPELLPRILAVYDLDPEDAVRAWVLLGRAHIPAKVLEHVEVHPSNITQHIAELAATWSGQFYPDMSEWDRQCMIDHINRSLL